MSVKPPTKPWYPESPSTICGDDPTPPASMALLLTAHDTMLAVAAMCYAQPAMMFEGNTSQTSTRRFSFMTPVGCKYAKALVTRSGSGTTQQSATNIKTTTSGGFSNANYVIKLYAQPFAGNEVYLEAEGTPATQIEIIESNFNPEAAPGQAMDRAILLPEALVPTVEDAEITYAAGLGLLVHTRSTDLSAL